MTLLNRIKKITPLRDLLSDSRTTGVLLFGCTAYFLDHMPILPVAGGSANSGMNISAGRFCLY